MSKHRSTLCISLFLLVAAMWGIQGLFPLLFSRGEPSTTMAVLPTITVGVAVTAPTVSPTMTPLVTPTPHPTATVSPSATPMPPTATPSFVILDLEKPPITLPSHSATPGMSSPTANRTAVLPSSRETGGQTVSIPAEIVRGDPTRRRIALTFDAGASAAPLPKILRELRQADIHSTFFLTGDWASQNPDSVRAIVAHGHEIANHSMTHPDLTTISDEQIVEELQATEEIVQKIGGCTTKPYFRPPFGARNQRVLAAAWSAGYRSVYWTIDSGDWRKECTAEGIINTVLGKATNGAIVVQHVGSPQTAEALPRIIVGLRERGFDIVPLSVIVQ